MKAMATAALIMMMISFLTTILIGGGTPNLCSEWRAKERNLFLGATYECVKWEPRDASR